MLSREIPLKIPVKVFFFGCWHLCRAWDENAATGKFIYDAGLRVSFIMTFSKKYLYAPGL